MMVSDSIYTFNAMGVLDSVYTFLAFIITCFLLFMLIIIYYVVNFIRDTILNHVEKRFPDLEFVRQTSVRSAVDTHRNMGIITLMVTVKGPCDPIMIKRRLIEDILDKKQNDGRYVYRYLRMTLTTRWGWYAWQNAGTFDIDNHLVICQPFYRGRHISDLNIQDYISETVSKYLVPDLPPWQITVIPNKFQSHDKYYLLIRIHHLLLSHQNLDLGDLLQLSHNKNETTVTRLESPAEVFAYNKQNRPHPFQDLYKPPKAIPLLYDQLSETFSNNWNEFLSAYDPIENPAILKNPNLKVTIAMFVIALISILKQTIQRSSINRFLIINEFQQRQLTFKLIFTSIWNTLNPFSLTLNVIKTSFNAIVFIFIKYPMFLACEFRSICMIYDEKYSDRSYIKAAIIGWSLVKDAMKEALYYWKLLYNGPRVIIEELLLSENHSKGQLQWASLCGRKVVSWSHPVKLEKIREIQDVTGASASEILITATSASIRDYLIQYSLDIPDNIHTTARYFPQEQLMHTKHKRPVQTTGGGVLLLALPIRNPFGLEYDPITELRAVQQTILRARFRQRALYLASLWQLEYGLITQILPSFLVRLILNMLSRKFPITLSEVAPATINESKKYYLWGQEVEDLMYWRPPQANICISLTLMTFGEYVRLGVMTDALLSPHHATITSSFHDHIKALSAAAGVTPVPNFSYMSDDSDSSGRSQSSGDRTMSSSSFDFEFDSRNYSEDDNNVNLDESFDKYPISKKIQFNITS